VRHPQCAKRCSAHTGGAHIRACLRCIILMGRVIRTFRGIRAGIPGDTRTERDIPAVDRVGILRALRAAG